MGYHSTDLVTRACLFALRAHWGQTRNNKDKSPLMDHLAAVARLVGESGGSDLEIAAAWLHDIVEDTLVTVEEVDAIFGVAIGKIVDGLTDPIGFKNLPLVERKQRQAERVRLKGDSVRRIKIADQIANVHDVAVDPPKKWNNEKCLEYVEGAKLVVEKCRYISIYLADEFDRVYLLAKNAHK